MSKQLSGALYAGLISLGLASTAEASLMSRLGGAAVYDTDLNITWLADANFAQTSGFDADGAMTWANANAWAASLTVGGFTDWRLPKTVQPDSSCSLQAGTQGFGANCTGSEMGHLFNVEGVSVASPGLFTNVQSNFYWSATEVALNPSNAWDFNFLFDNQNTVVKGSDEFAWAVRSGDVAASAPEPTTLILLGVGLAGIGMVRRGKRRLC